MWGMKKYYFCAIFTLMQCTGARQMREFDFFKLFYAVSIPFPLFSRAPPRSLKNTDSRDTENEKASRRVSPGHGVLVLVLPGVLS
jgi:hypothetical protein